ncbi:hypothetical protein CAEBREN_04785 [Caenorhabditis brenneri]|uniref:Sdz-33 F-box domain-containing protein n=1 Tax=Caenorhabditis brenneri TaxID=135651 RepID=G0N2D4_CAEBE|nr:hypothetical protein CAEBREN_04785 [Caenorhabditis brenneri]
MYTFFLKYQKSENSKLELQKVLAQLLAAFRCPVTSFEYIGWCNNEQCWVSVLKCIIQNQVQPLESLYLDRSLEMEDLEWALRNVKVTRKVNIQTFGIQLYTIQSILRPNLMMLKSCKYIELNCSSLTLSTLNVFMKEWMAGDFPNLRYMLIKSGKFKWYEHILDFERDELKQLSVRRRLAIDENLSVECTGGVDIQADNGTRATMQIDRKKVNWFELFVWND